MNLLLQQSYLHSFDGEESRQIGSKCREHEYNEQPIGGHKSSTR